MLVELHIIQNFAPSNLNRDDTNNPKDCMFGGVRRARISSQCIKRAIRHAPAFAETTQVDLGSRTRLIATRWFLPMLVDAGKDPQQAADVALAMAAAYAGGVTGERTKVLVYVSPAEIQYIVERVLDQWDVIIAGLYQDKPDTGLLDAIIKDLIKETKGRTSAPDIALFGRMLADKPNLNLDAACQVAHAISTHRVSMEMDFFTAVDDLQPSGETGAGMMGITGFNSATFYRYACINWEQLVQNLDGDTALARQTVEGFLRASVAAIPTGKQNAFAAQNPPSFLLGVVRTDGMNWSLVNAFERPVQPDSYGGLVKPSVEALDAYWGRLVQVYGRGEWCIAALALDNDLQLPNLGMYLCDNLQKWLDTMLAPLSEV